MNIDSGKKDPKFDPTKFNQKFDAKEKILASQEKINNDQLDDTIYSQPHNESMETIIINIRNLFFIILEMLIDKKNPLPFLFAAESRKFSFSLFLIIFGTLLLLLASLMKSSN